jgi:hypothetical protein
MIDISKLTPQQLERFIHLQALVERQAKANDRVRALRAYYDGEHPVLLTERQQEFLGDLLDSEDTFTFAHNLVRTVVDTLSERLNVTGFDVNPSDDEAERGPEDDIAATLWRWWEDNRLSSKQDDLYLTALRDGLSFAVVSYNAVEDRPDIVVHQVDDGTAGVRVHYDPENPQKMLFAVRYFWTFNPLRPGETGIERKTVYLPGEIRKYQRDSRVENGWIPVQDAGDLSWPLPWVDSRGEPLGIPVAPFANPGGSEMAQIIGLQNALNKAWLDLIAGADAHGFPILVAEYAERQQFATVDDADLDGPDELLVAPGRVLEIDKGTIRRIEAANLSSIIEVIWTLTTAISGVSRTPQYYLRPVGGGEVPSGESLKQLESGIVNRALKRHLVFGQSWQDVMQIAYRVQQTFGRETLPRFERTPTIQPQWKDPNVRNELAEAQVAKEHQGLNVPQDEVWRRLGYMPEQIEQFKRMQQATDAAKLVQVATAMRDKMQMEQQQRAQQEQRAQQDPRAGGGQ